MWTAFRLVVRDDGVINLELERPASGQSARVGPVTWARHEGTGCVAVVHGRIHYRSDLADSIGLFADRAPHDGRAASDARFALDVFRAAGRAGLERLEGEFSLALWDARRQCLLGLRDPLGGAPLYWWHHRGARGFGSTLADDSQATGAGSSATRRRSVAPEYLAECLLRSMSPGEPATDLTPCRLVHRVAPGCVRELRTSGPATEQRHWDWAGRIVAQPAGDVADAAAGLREKLVAAVRERVAGRRAAAHLSGGLDSTTVAALAAGHGAQGGRVTALALIYERGELLGERPYIDAALRDIPGLSPCLIIADDILDYGIRDAADVRHDEPRSGLRGLATHRALLDHADRAGADLVLTGVGSDEILIGRPPMLADALRRGRLLEALRRASALSRQWNQGLWSVLHEDAVCPLWPVFGREGLGPYLRGGHSRWPRLGAFTVPPWIDPEFAREHRLFDRGLANSAKLCQPAGSPMVHQPIIDASFGDWNRFYLTSPRAIELSHPFRDPRVMTFTLGLPAPLLSAGRLSKGVLRESARGLIPEKIRLREGKCGFDEVNGRGLSRHRSRIEAWARAAAISELGIIDLDSLAGALRQAAVGVGDLIACDRLGQTLALMIWYEQWTRPSQARRFDEFRFVAVPEDAVLAAGACA